MRQPEIRELTETHIDWLTSDEQLEKLYKICLQFKDYIVNNEDFALGYIFGFGNAKYESAIILKEKRPYNTTEKEEYLNIMEQMIAAISESVYNKYNENR